MPRSEPQYVDSTCSIRRQWNGDHCTTHWASVLTCPECGKQFHSQRADATTCSDRCRKRRARKPAPAATATSGTPAVTLPSAEETPITNDTGAAVTLDFHSTFSTRLTTIQTEAIDAMLRENPTGDVVIRFIRPRRQT
jgi:hypothetical protein